MAKPLLLDANLAILLIVGQADRSYISKHKRLSAFQEADFDHLTRLVGLASGVVFCPNVLAETSNLLRQASEPIRSQCASAMARLVGETEERVVASSDAVVHGSYQVLGLTDAVLLILAKEGAVLLTVDLDLFVAAKRARFEAINFNHERDARLS